jgi:hypothetical protein
MLIVKANPDALFQPLDIHNRDVTLSEQMQERDDGGVFKKSYDDSLVLLTEVYPIKFDII